jgi:uncharacterized protein
MMDITPQIPDGHKILTGYGNGGFSVNKEPLDGHLFIMAGHCQAWQVADATELSFDDFIFLDSYQDNIDVLLLGCGLEHKPLPPSLARALKQKGIICEMMTTGAACRTYNVLLSESRNVAAALIAV